ncbi:MAG TPA: DUF1015 domain-containing protein [Ignavibacteria bacterium]|nr:DUF1015 domain-containing protein [Ignavibacteria bacterium]
MAVIKPFKALRPKKEVAQKVASVPYDVVNREEAKQIVEGNELSFLRIGRAESTLDNSIDAYSPEVYKKAKENLDKLITDAPLIQDDTPRFYLYRLIMDGRPQTGIAATFSVADYENNVILKHENTRKEKEDDRTNHIITTSAQTGPVFLTYKGVDKINEVVNNTITNQEPEYDFTAEDGITHKIWLLPEELNSVIIEELNNVKSLYIADGHHRAASAWRARDEKRNNNPNHSGEEEYNYFLGVLFPAEQLNILAYNRVVHDLNGLSKDELLNSINNKFSIEKTGEKEPAETKTFCMYLDGAWYKLTARDSVIASNSLTDNVGEKLDVSILQDFLLNPILGIDDVRTNKRIDFIGGMRGTAELEKLVNTGKAAVAFSLHPLSVDDLINISDAGEKMPPKSTWFEPKLRDGLIIHLI